MEKLVEISTTEIQIPFTPNTKCRSEKITIKSLHPKSPIAFKLQTSSPNKFLVNPPSGIIPPLSSVSFQIILKPQSQIPPTFPRSRSDRFLLLTAPAPNNALTDNVFNENNGRTYDVKLKVYFVGSYLLGVAVENGDLEGVKGILKRQRLVFEEMGLEEKELLLGKAAAGKVPEIFRVLVEAGLRVRGDHEVDPTVCGDVDGDRRSVVDVATDKGHNDRVRILERGEAVLYAARRGELELLESLLEKGAVVNFCDQYGLTALHVAAIKGNKDAVMMLLEFGADVDCRDGEGNSPLHLAVEGGSIETVEVLISRGANVSAESNKGTTPLYIAKLMEYEDIAQLLLEEGANM